MFSKEVYVRRRARLLQLMKGCKGMAIFIGNAEAPAQYIDNCYKFRQDSSWIYYWGIDKPGWFAIIDLESGKETLYSNDISLDDIIWMGPQPSVKEQAEAVGVSKTGNVTKFIDTVKRATFHGLPIHFIPPSRNFTDLILRRLGVNTKRPSVSLINAIVSMRLVKEDIEIAEIDAACDLGYEMHTVARNGIVPGAVEQEIVGKMEGVALGKGWGVSFPTILTQHGEIMHNHDHYNVIEPGRLMVIDAGVESNSHYASDFTRTYPTSGKFTTRQKEIYQIVLECNELAFSLTKPGVTYRDVHLATVRHLLDSLKGLGLVSGDVDDMVAKGIAGLFMPHGLGHNMGIDVHDMEDLGEDYVGYDDDQVRAKQLGLGNLRMARRLVPGHVVTDEPGIYFIPALIEQWKSKKTGKGFVNYDKLEAYYDFGGIRLEDDVLVTADGARRLGSKRLPITPDDVEAAMKDNGK